MFIVGEIMCKIFPEAGKLAKNPSVAVKYRSGRESTRKKKCVWDYLSRFVRVANMVASEAKDDA